MLNSVIGGAMSLDTFLICELSALVLGIFTALVFSIKSRHSGSWIATLVLLPPVVTLVIMLVNGNIGAGLAVAGTFALVRFRSVPGSAKEIVGLFFAVSLGLACGMGYVVIAAIYFVIIAAVVLAMQLARTGELGDTLRQLKITIPENLDYEGLFDDVFDKFTKSRELIRVKTTNMGTLYELTYNIKLSTPNICKEFIDELRCRNGNLNIICGRETDRDLM